MGQKRAAALAALAVAGVASAQSSVTLFGVVDASITGYSNSSRNAFTQGSVKVSKTSLGSSGYNSSRLGFRGTEDLGGGLAASFWLEAGINNDDGTGKATGGGLMFNRRSTVSLSSGLGEVRLGRDYSPTYWNDTVFDPFGTNGSGTSLIDTANRFATAANGIGGFGGNQTYDRASNSIGYFLPANLGGFYGQLMYSFPEKVKYDPGTATPAALNNARAGRYLGGRIGYANGPLDIALSYGSSTTADDYYGGTTNKVNTLNFGTSYDLGPVKLFGELSQAKLRFNLDGPFVASDSVTGEKLNGWLVGVTVPIGAGTIRASYSGVQYKSDLFVTTPKADKLALGYVYNLSKRTAVYTTVARVSNKNGASLGVNDPTFYAPATGANLFTPKTSIGYDFGIRHAF